VSIFPPRNQTQLIKIKSVLHDRDLDRILHRCPCHLPHFVPPDFLLEEISRNHEVSRIKSIGGAAQVRFASVCRSSEIAYHVTSSARTRLVEIHSGSHLPRPRLATTTAFPALTEHFLFTKHPCGPGHVLSFSCAQHRGDAWRARPYGCPRRNVC
jgi:hypothetical protein